MKLANVLMTVLVLASTSQAFAGFQKITRCIGDDKGVYSFTWGYSGSGDNREDFSYPAHCLNDKCSLKKVQIEDTEVVQELDGTGLQTNMSISLLKAGNVTMICTTDIGDED